MPKLVVLDPGHGGADPGAVGFVVEKDINLDIAKHARARLRQYKNVEVVMTREGDQTVSLAERVRLANERKADVFVSIHCNAGGGEGFESYRYPGSVEGLLLQNAVHDEIWTWLVSVYGIFPTALEAEPVEFPEGLAGDALEAWIKDRGRKAERFYVLKNTVMPAVLLECLFVDDERDAMLLQDANFRYQLGVRIADGIANYLGLELGAMWNPEEEIRKLKERKLIHELRPPTQQVTWGEAATIINRLYEQLSTTIADLEHKTYELNRIQADQTRFLSTLKDGLRKAIEC